MTTPFMVRRGIESAVRTMNALSPWITERGGIRHAVRLPGRDAVQELCAEQRMCMYKMAATKRFPESVQQLVFEDQQDSVTYANHSLYELIVQLKWDFHEQFEVFTVDATSPAHCHRRAFFRIERR